MLLLKIWYRFTGTMIKTLYRLLYGHRMRWGSALHLRKGFQATVDGEGCIAIGDNVFFNNGCALHAMQLIRIGNGTIFGENVRIYDHNHRFADLDMPIKEQGYSTAPVTIGDHCWIGANVTLLKGARIGNDCVIGAGCVIDRKIPDGSVVKMNAELSVEPVHAIHTADQQHSGSKALEPLTRTRGPVRVLVLDTVMDRGGAETMTMNYLRHMDRNKVIYDFLVNRSYHAAYEDEIAALGGRVYRMCPMYPQYFTRYKKEFREFLKAHPEYRIIHSNLEERSYFPLRIAAEMGIPVRIAHAHNRPVGVDVKSVFREYFRLRLPKYTTHMFACGQEASDWLFGIQRRKQVIQEHNAIDTARYRFDPSAAAAIRKEFGVNDSNTLVVGHVGRFFPQKNHVFLIDVFAALHRKHPDSVLWLVGGGEQDDKLRNKISDKVRECNLTDSVRFFGVRDDVPRLMQGMDAFVLPSLYEGLPMTMIEAQACGLPCTISDRVPTQCDITGNVRIVPLKAGADAWADQILTQVNHPSLAERADGARAVADAGYDIMPNAQWLQNWYPQALAEVEKR